MSRRELDNIFTTTPNFSLFARLRPFQCFPSVGTEEDVNDPKTASLGMTRNTSTGFLQNKMSKFRVLTRGNRIRVVGFRNCLGREVGKSFSGPSSIEALQGGGRRVRFTADTSVIVFPRCACFSCLKRRGRGLRFASISNKCTHGLTWR